MIKDIIKGSVSRGIFSKNRKRVSKGRSQENNEGMQGRLGMTGYGAWWQSGQVVQVGCGTTITSTAPVQRLHLRPLPLMAASALQTPTMGGGKGRVWPILFLFILPTFISPSSSFSTLVFPSLFLPVSLPKNKKGREKKAACILA